MNMGDSCSEGPMKIADMISGISSPCSVDLPTFYSSLYQSIVHIFNARNFYLALQEAGTQRIQFPFYKDVHLPHPHGGFRLSRDHALMERVISKGDPLLLSSGQIQDLLGPARGTKRGINMWMGVPLSGKEGVAGAMVVKAYRRPHPFGPSDLDVLSTLARHAALFIQCRRGVELAQDQRRRMGDVLEFAPMGIAMVQKRRFKWVNVEMVRLFGYDSPVDFLDRELFMVYTSHTAYEFVEKNVYNVLDQEGCAEYEMEMRRKDGSLFPAHLRLSRPPGRNDCEILVVTDISQRLEDEEKKQDEERLQGVLEMAGAVCHEINQPLQTLMGQADLLLMDATGGTEDRVRAIKAQADRIASITRKLTKITRYKTLEYPGTRRIVDIWGAGEKEP